MEIHEAWVWTQGHIAGGAEVYRSLRRTGFCNRPRTLALDTHAFASLLQTMAKQIFLEDDPGSCRPLLTLVLPSGRKTADQLLGNLHPKAEIGRRCSSRGGWQA